MAEVAQELLSISLEDEMQQSYLDYAMSVIVGRALPDVRDGLKPVHRRVQNNRIFSSDIRFRKRKGHWKAGKLYFSTNKSL